MAKHLGRRYGPPAFRRRLSVFQGGSRCGAAFLLRLRLPASSTWAEPCVVSATTYQRRELCGSAGVSSLPVTRPRGER